MRIVDLNKLSEEERKKVLEEQQKMLEQRQQASEELQRQGNQKFNELVDKSGEYDTNRHTTTIGNLRKAYKNNNDVKKTLNDYYNKNKTSLWEQIKGIAGGTGKIVENTWLGLDNGIKSFQQTLGRTITNTQADRVDFFNKQHEEMLRKANKNTAENDRKIDEIVNNPLLSGDRIREESKKVTQRIQDKQNKNTEKIQENANSINNPVGKYLAGNIMPAIGQMAPGLISGGAGATYFIGSATGNYYNDAKQRGMTEDEATKYSGIMGIIEGSLESIGGKLTTNVGKQLLKKNIKGALVNYGLDIGENFLEESIVEPISELAAQTTGGKDKANWDNIGQRFIQSGIDGAVTSMITGGISGAIGGVASNVRNNKYTDIDTGKLLNKDSQNWLKQAENVINQNKDTNLQQNTTTTQNNPSTQQTIQEINKIAQNGNMEQILPTQNYYYEKSDNTKIDNLRKDANKYWDNSEKTKNYVNMLEKIITDKDVEIRLDVDLKTADGRIANGSYSNGVITINPNSTRAGEFIAIHELTHAIGTKEMINMINTYRQSNTEFDTAVKGLLQNYEGTEISEEALSDISAQLFGNQEFINNIAQNNPNIFQKLYSEIKYLWHQFRGYKNQDQFIEDLYYKWTQAYKNNNSNIVKNNEILYNANERESDIYDTTRSNTKYENPRMETEDEKVNTRSEYEIRRIEEEKYYESNRKEVEQLIKDEIKIKFNFEDDVINEIYNNVDKDEITEQDIYDAFDKHREITMSEPSQQIINNIQSINKILRNTRLDISYIKGDIADWNDLRKSQLGKFRLANDGRGVDTLYKELLELFPGYFDANITNPTEQLLTLIEWRNITEEELLKPETYRLTDEDLIEIKDFILNSKEYLKSIKNIDFTRDNKLNTNTTKYSIQESENNSDSFFNSEDFKKYILPEIKERYQYENKNKITETIEELKKRKETLDINTDEGWDNNFIINQKIKALENGYDTIYDYLIEHDINELKKDYKYNPKILTDKINRLKQTEKKQEKLQKEIEEATPIKRVQYEIIQKTNPMFDDEHVGIRSPADIKTFEEAIQDEESFSWGDYTKEDAERDLKRNKVKIYSSYAIKNGVFVSTSYQQALDYAGGDRAQVHSKEISPNRVAWINGDEGQYASINAKYFIENQTWQSYLDKNYKPTGTRTNLEDIKLPTQETSKEVSINSPKKEIIQEEKFPTRHEVIQNNRETARENIKNISTWKDKKSGIRYQLETMERNMYDIIPDKAEAKKINDTYFEPIHTSEAEKQKFINNYNDRIRQFDLNKYESEAVQFLGEKKYNPEFNKGSQEDISARNEIATRINKNIENGKIDQEKVNNAIEEFRKIYDELFELENNKLRENGYKEKPYRKGYFPHFVDYVPETKTEKVLNKLGFKIDKRSLPTDIAGITEQFVPGKTWNRSALERKGNKTDYNALKGFDTYIAQASDNIFHTENIQRLRGLENEIRYQYSDKGVQERIDNILNDETLYEDEKQASLDGIFEQVENPMPNLVTELRRYTNALANKKSEADRSIEQLTRRSIYSTVNAIENRFGANAVGLNIGSAITNFIPITQAYSQVSTKNMGRAIIDTVKSYANNDGFVDKSVFLTSRLNQSEKLYKTSLEKISDKTSFLFNAIDEVTSNIVVRGKYLENIQNGMSEAEAIKNADQFARNVIADRSKGALPTKFEEKNPVTKMFTQFQLEVNNQYRYMFKNLPRDLAEKGLAGIALAFFKMFVGAWIFNEASEKITGRKPAFSPIDLVSSSYKTITDKDMKTYDKVANIGTDIAEQLPFVGGLVGGGRVPVNGAIPNVANLAKAGIGLATGEMDSNKAMNTIGKEISKPLYYLLPPFGGGQIKKSVEGIQTVAQGGSYGVDSKGEETLQFPVENANVGDYIKAGIFGKYALPLAKDYANSGYKSLNAKDTKGYKDTKIPYKEFITYANSSLKKKEEKINFINNMNINEQQKWDMYCYDIFESTERKKDKGSQLEDAKFAVKNGISKSEYIKLYNNTRSRNMDMPTQEENKKLIENGIKLKNYMDYSIKVHDETKKQKTNGDIKENGQLKNKDKIQILLDSKYPESEKMAIYKNYINSEDKKTQLVEKLNFPITEYLKYKTQEFKNDKDENEETIKGSKKEKVYNYLNDIYDNDLSQDYKKIICKIENINTYDKDIVNFVTNYPGLTGEDQKELLEIIGFDVDKNGYIKTTTMLPIKKYIK